MMDYQLLTLAEVCKLLAVSRPTVYDRLRAGTFPKPFYIGKAPRWRLGEINAWVDQLREDT